MCEVVKCKCGAVFAACVVGHQDAEWHKNLRKYMAQGYQVSHVAAGDFIFSKCECVKEEVAKVDPNQLRIF